MPKRRLPVPQRILAEERQREQEERPLTRTRGGRQATAASPGSIACDVCGKVVSNMGALANHKKAKHCVREEERVAAPPAEAADPTDALVTGLLTRAEAHDEAAAKKAWMDREFCSRYTQGGSAMELVATLEAEAGAMDFTGVAYRQLAEQLRSARDAFSGLVDKAQAVLDATAEGGA